MIMNPVQHPDDERLSALAAGDDDARRDAALVSHVEACATCRVVVDELQSLRVHLAAMPDLAPPRPIRIALPERAAAPSGFAETVRRLFAPVLAAGATLALVGAVGLGAQSGVFGSASGPASGDGGAGAPGAEAAASAAAGEPAGPSEAAAAAEGGGTVTDAGANSGESRDALASSPAAFAAPEVELQHSEEPSTARDTFAAEADSGPMNPWLPVFVGGVVLAAAALFLRFALVPRAG